MQIPRLAGERLAAGLMAICDASWLAGPVRFFSRERVRPAPSLSLSLSLPVELVHLKPETIPARAEAALQSLLLQGYLAWGLGL